MVLIPSISLRYNFFTIAPSFPTVNSIFDNSSQQNELHFYGMPDPYPAYIDAKHHVARRHPEFSFMKRKNPLVIGTIILTLTGMVSRLIGFFYRIYLSRLFGEEGMGIYQLLSPIMALTFSITAAGLQTAISKFVAAETSTKDYKASFRVLFVGMTVSLLLSTACTWAIYTYSQWIAADFLLEKRTASMLRIIALSIPLGAVHSCINGYFYGIKKTGVPSATQLAEQLCRIACVYLASHAGERYGITPHINVAVIGLVIGEGLAMVISIVAIFLRYSKLAGESLFRCATFSRIAAPIPYYRTLQNLMGMALPLSATRIVINLLQSIEAIQIPNQLQVYGYDSATSLSVYGVLTGMAFPFIFFPGALINSICVLLLPIISEADGQGNLNGVRRAASKSLLFSSLFGTLCSAFFLIFGGTAGNMLFQSKLAGHFILTLSFICPFLYISATMSSVLHGLGKTGITFVLNVTALGIRLLFVFIFIPTFGIEGYLWGLLISHISTTGLEVLAVKYYTRS